MKTLETRLKLFAVMLERVTERDFGYDPCIGGVLERQIAESNVALCEKVGGMIQEALQGDYDSLDESEQNEDQD